MMMVVTVEVNCKIPNNLLTPNIAVLSLDYKFVTKGNYLSWSIF